MKFYHGTSWNNWRKIRSDGVLWGIPHPDNLNNRYTYLTPNIKEAEHHGEGVLLEVEYEPTGIYGVDNYGFDPPPGHYCWQFCVFVPISITKVKKADT
tara:strand:+ start:13735 stop:14028 length:294 start_codon:yes stop_codon:yes gene_type:complete